MNLENMWLNENSQSQKDTYYLILFVWNVQNMQIHRNRKGMSDGQILGGGVLGSDLLMDTAFDFEVMETFWN